MLRAPQSTHWWPVVEAMIGLRALALQRSRVRRRPIAGAVSSPDSADWAVRQVRLLVERERHGTLGPIRLKPRVNWIDDDAFAFNATSSFRDGDCSTRLRGSRSMLAA